VHVFSNAGHGFSKYNIHENILGRIHENKGMSSTVLFHYFCICEGVNNEVQIGNEFKVDIKTLIIFCISQDETVVIYKSLYKNMSIYNSA
jgi:hypothetical protein